MDGLPVLLSSGGRMKDRLHIILVMMLCEARQKNKIPPSLFPKFIATHLVKILEPLMT